MAVFQLHCFDIYNYIIHDPMNKQLKKEHILIPWLPPRSFDIYKNVNWQFISSSLHLSDNYVNNRHQHYF